MLSHLRPNSRPWTSAGSPSAFWSNSPLTRPSKQRKPWGGTKTASVSTFGINELFITPSYHCAWRDRKRQASNRLEKIRDHWIEFAELHSIWRQRSMLRLNGQHPHNKVWQCFMFHQICAHRLWRRPPAPFSSVGPVPLSWVSPTGHA